MSATEQLAVFLSGLTIQDLGQDARRRAKDAVLDAVGVGLFGSTTPWVGAVRNVALSTSGQGASTVWGTKHRLTAPHAALVNGVAVHGIEMDDRSFDLNVHNGAATIPAVLALAQDRDIAGEHLIVAVVAGYEAAYRLARATRGTITRHYPNGIKTAFGAAAGAARVLGLDADATANAFGVAGSMVSGLYEFKHAPAGGMVKRLQGGGWPAYVGVTAALLASRGFTGPRAVLEGPYGVARSFSSREPDLEALTAGLGDSFAIEAWETKRYAGWGIGASSIDAVRLLIEKHGVRPDDVVRVRIACSSKVLQNAALPQPDSIMAAQYDLRFLVAAAFHHDLSDARVWTERILRDEAILRLRSTVEAELDESREEIYVNTNDHGGVALTAVLLDGTHRTVAVRHASGTPANPLDESQLTAKFMGLATAVLSETDARHLAEVTGSLDRRARLTPFFELLAKMR